MDARVKDVGCWLVFSSIFAAAKGLKGSVFTTPSSPASFRELGDGGFPSVFCSLKGVRLERMVPGDSEIGTPSLAIMAVVGKGIVGTSVAAIRDRGVKRSGLVLTGASAI